MKNIHALPRIVMGCWLACAAPAAQAEIYAYSAIPLTGSQDVPAIATTGYGWFTGIYNSDTRTMTFTFNWTLGGGAPLTLVHFHGPATTTENADVAIGIVGAAAANSGRHSGTVTLTAAQEADLLAGLWYINLHSTTYPAGEIRGQLIENSAGPGGPVYSATGGTLNLPGVVVPQGGVYDATLQVVPGSNPLRFDLTGATQVR